MDLFEEWLNKKDDSKCKKKDREWVRRALFDDSNKKVYEKKHCEPYKGKTNSELATYGDAIIKFCYSKILFDNYAAKYPNLTEAKKDYESDKVFVTKVARHYNLINYIDFDGDDGNLRQDYEYDKNVNQHKYIATAVEAMIGAIYIVTKDLDEIIKLVETWMTF